MTDFLKTHGGYFFGGVVGVVVTTVMTGGDPSTLARYLGGATMGAVCGLIPYFVGSHENEKISGSAFWACTGSGLVLGVLLALPVALVFTLVFWNRKPAGEQELSEIEEE